MADDNKKVLEKLRKLYEAQRIVQDDYVEKMASIAQEVDSLLGGGVGIGEILKRLEEHFDQVWCVRYAPGQKEQYLWNFKADRGQWKRLLRTLDVEELERRVIVYLKDTDPFYVRAKHPFNLFVKAINQFSAGGPTEGRGRQTTRLTAAMDEIRDEEAQAGGPRLIP